MWTQNIVQDKRQYHMDLKQICKYNKFQIDVYKIKKFTNFR